jgi:predicted  nucleic acid-binding Zn ribbon protein
MANAQTTFHFSSYLQMQGNDRINESRIMVQVDTAQITIQTKDTSINHRIISQKYNPYQRQTEYKLTCGGKMRVDWMINDNSVKSFFFKCPGTHLFSSLSFQEAVINQEYE